MTVTETARERDVTTHGVGRADARINQSFVIFETQHYEKFKKINSTLCLQGVQRGKQKNLHPMPPDGSSFESSVDSHNNPINALPSVNKIAAGNMHQVILIN